MDRHAHRALSGLGPPAHAEEGDPEAVALLRQGGQRMRPSSSISVYRIEITRPDWSRSMRFRSHEAHRQARISHGDHLG
jgi:hypothetical protein